MFKNPIRPKNLSPQSIEKLIEKEIERKQMIEERIEKLTETLNSLQS